MKLSRGNQILNFQPVPSQWCKTTLAYGLWDEVRKQIVYSMSQTTTKKLKITNREAWRKLASWYT